MSILVIGQSAFLAQPLQNIAGSDNWHFIDHQPALDSGKWPEGVTSVINFACDPIVLQGEYSDLDHKYAKIAQEHGASYIMLSSRTVYGLPEKPATLTEKQNFFNMITPYGHAKRLIENDLRENFENVTILRLGNIFGFEYQSENPRSTFFGTMLQSLKEKGSINFSMNGLTQRDFLPLSHFTRSVALISSAPQSGIFNLGAGFGTACGDIARWIIQGYGEGGLAAEEGSIIDSFVLDMMKTNTTYNLDTIDTADIKKACIKIGEQLKEI